MDTETGSSNNLADVLKNGFSNGMKKPTTIPTISISTKKLVPQRGWKRLCLRTFSTVNSSLFS